MRTITRSERGYSLIEMLISTAIMVTVTGAIFAIVNPSQGTARVQPEFSDMQQRGRVGADVLNRDLLMAGAGPYLGPNTGSLMNYFPPVMPYRSGRLYNGTAGTYTTDAISIVYVPGTASQTTLSSSMPNESAELKVNAQNNCPPGDQLCGFEEGESLLIFDPVSGAWDSFEVTQVQDDAAHLQHRGQIFNQQYDACPPTCPPPVVVEVANHTYYWDQPNLRLMHYDGIATEVPVLDNVVGVTFTYYGDPNPPTSPKPPIGQSNCLFNADGTSKLATLPSPSGALVELTEAVLTDGPLCGAGSSAFDPDLYRVRKIRVQLRVQAADPGLRPTAAALASSPNLRRLFAQPGTARLGQGATFVPDYQIQFDVTPRNLNLAR